MKKVFALLLISTAVCIGFDFSGKEAKAEPAQPMQAVGSYCCDGNGVRRCVINPSYIGTACYCNYQGWGIVCF